MDVQFSGKGSKTLSKVDVLLVLIFAYLSLRLLRNIITSVRTGTSPPGPPGTPLFGNAYQIPSDRQWLKFDEWIRKYGDVVRLTVTGQPIILLGSVQAANDLLDARGSIYSDRPQAVMVGELVGWNRGLGYSPGPHDPRFRELRRLFNQFIGPRRTEDDALLLTQETYAKKLLLRLLDEPKSFITHIRQSAAVLLLRVAYGYDVAEGESEDYMVTIAERAMQGFSRASEPGAFLVDTLPWLKYVPEWFPGAQFQSLAKAMRQDRERLYDIPYDFVKSQMLSATPAQSFVQAYLKGKGTPSPVEEDLIKAAAASLYSGGIDSTPSSLSSFILAMTLHPEIQARAQAEVDSVIGGNWQCLPSLSDRPNLPYVNAIVLELFRWNPTVPLGLAHRLRQDDVYRGYYLPKGTIIWANIWSMLHDETVYPEPSRFRPERYLNDRGTLRALERAEDPSVIAFGFGRRICPGMFLAQNSIFISVCMMLYVFDISMTKDGNGKPIVPKVEYDGFMCHPRPFPCSIRPRSREAESLIRGALADEVMSV